jgi:hypothetical protein
VLVRLHVVIFASLIISLLNLSVEKEEKNPMRRREGERRIKNRAETRKKALQLPNQLLAISSMPKGMLSLYDDANEEARALVLSLDSAPAREREKHFAFSGGGESARETLVAGDLDSMSLFFRNISSMLQLESNLHRSELCCATTRPTFLAVPCGIHQ